MKLFKKTFAVIAIMGMSYMFAQDIAGDYRLNGTNVRYTSLYRGATPVALYITDSYGLGVTLPALTFQPMSPMNQFINGPYPKNALNAIGVNLNMSMYSDGTGHIYEGSMYPTAVFDEETCTSVAGATSHCGPASHGLGNGTVGGTSSNKCCHAPRCCPLASSRHREADTPAARAP